MTTLEFCEVLGELDAVYVEQAHTQAKRKPSVWLKWCAAAACLCLIAGSAIAIRRLAPSPAAGSTMPSGSLPEGVDPIIASVAVYPATESILDVETATIASISETQAYSMETLGTYLPASLPEGFHLDHANLYETTMKSGTTYYLLRVTYSNGVGADVQSDTAPDPNSFGDSFTVSVWNHTPKTEKKLYTPAELTETKIKHLGSTTFHITYGEVCVGISPGTLAPADLLALIRPA